MSTVSNSLPKDPQPINANYQIMISDKIIL